LAEYPRVRRTNAGNCGNAESSYADLTRGRGELSVNRPGTSLGWWRAISAD
jgi:hypothetical protein